MEGEAYRRTHCRIVTTRTLLLSSPLEISNISKLGWVRTTFLELRMILLFASKVIQWTTRWTLSCLRWKIQMLSSNLDTCPLPSAGGYFRITFNSSFCFYIFDTKLLWQDNRQNLPKAVKVCSTGWNASQSVLNTSRPNMRPRTFIYTPGTRL